MTQYFAISYFNLNSVLLNFNYFDIFTQSSYLLISYAPAQNPYKQRESRILLRMLAGAALSSSYSYSEWALGRFSTHSGPTYNYYTTLTGRYRRVNYLRICGRCKLTAAVFLYVCICKRTTLGIEVIFMRVSIAYTMPIVMAVTL